MAEAAIPQVSLSMGSDAVFDIECAPCSADGQHKEAVRYCRDCGAHLCADCVGYHAKLPSLKHHQLMDNEATLTTTQGKPQVLDACTERCPDHKNEIIKLFCPDHNTTACVICMALKHKACERMEYIEDAAAGLEARRDYKEFTARLGDLTQQSEDTVTLALESKQRSSDCHTKTIQDLDAFEEELVNTLHQHMEAMRDQAGQIYAQDTGKMDKLASQGNKVLTELRAVATNVNNLKSKKHFCKLFVEMKQREKTLSKFQENLEGMREDKVTAYTFQPDEGLRAIIIKQDGIGKMVKSNPESGRPISSNKPGQASSKQNRGTSDVRNKAENALNKQDGGTPDVGNKAENATNKQDRDTPDVRNKAENATNKQDRGTSDDGNKAENVTNKQDRGTSEGRNKAENAHIKQDKGTSEGRNRADKAPSKQIVKTPTRNVKKLDDINVKSADNKKTCWISGMAVVSEDKVVVVDYNNDTIKLIDTTRNKIVSEHKPEEYPYDVTSYQDTVAATLPGANKIVFLKHAKGLVHDRQISVNGSCMGIDWHDDKLYVVFNDQKKLEVITTTGTVLQTFSTTADGQQLFQVPRYVTVSATNQRIYVSEYWVGRVVVLDLAGNQTGTYEDGELGSPKQLAVDRTGVMFLCDHSNDTVHLLSPSGQKLKILLTKQDGVGSPFAVCYCEKNGRLYVGSYGCDTIKVYNVS